MSEQRSSRKRVFVIFSALCIVVFVSVQIDRLRIEARCQAKLDAVIAQIEVDDPYWTFQANEALRPTLPLEQNSVVLVEQCHALMGERQFLAVRPNGIMLLYQLEPQHLLDREGHLLLEESLKDTEEVRRLTQRLKDYPQGRREAVEAPELFGMLATKENQRTDRLIAYMRLDSERLLGLNQGDGSVNYLLGMLNLARVAEGELLLASQTELTRQLHDIISHLQRLLGMTTSKLELRRLQQELEREIPKDYERDILRSRRADLQLYYPMMEQHPEILALVFRTATIGNSWYQTVDPALARVSAWNYRPYLKGDQSAALDYITRIIAVTNLPPHQRDAAAVQEPSPPKDREHHLSQYLGFGFHQDRHNAHMTQARLRCAVVALALERYRHLVGSWPTTLADLPQTILEQIPLDPYSGKPLLYCKRCDGVTVYSVGQDRTDGKGDLKTDIPFRLFNPDQRRLPALPPPAPLKVIEDLRNFP